MKRRITKKNIPMNASRCIVLFWAVSVLLCVSICMIAAAAASPETECVITADGAETTVVCTGNSAEQALAAAGVELLDGDSCSVQERGGVLYVDVVRAKVVSLTVNGQTEFFRTGCGTVGAFLAERGIALDSHDTVSADPDAAVTDGMAITVSRTDTQTVAMQVDVDYETEYRDDPDAYEGETAVVQEGKNGAKSITYTITSKDGVVTGLKAGDEQLLYQPVPQIVAVGTKPRPAQEAASGAERTESGETSGSSSGQTSGASSASADSGNASAGVSAGTSGEQAQGSTVQAWDGTTYTYSKVLSMTATAYTFNSGANITASGAPAQVGIVAADLSYLPMGTIVYIVSASGSWEYGYAVVGDTGVSGATIDLFFNTYDECIQFGVRDALVYVIG